MKTLVMALSVLALVACNKKEESTSSVVTSALSPFVGTWGGCKTSLAGSVGSNFATGSYLIQLKINSNGTYTHNRWYYDDSNTCTGSSNGVSWQQSGNITVLGDSASVTGAKEIEFEATTSYVTAYNTTNFNHLTDFRTAYAGYPGATATWSNPNASNAHNTAGRNNFPDFIPDQSSYSLFKLSGTTLTTHTPYEWEMGGQYASAPTTIGTFNLLKQ